MSAGGLRYDRFRVNGYDEWLMRVGPEDGPAVLFVPPLFEEMNRTRALLAAVMRELANKGFCCTLPDLPGTGESERALQTCGWADWQEAVRAVDRPSLVASFRGGALLDAVQANGWWRFAPVNGASLLRDLTRTEAAAGASARRHSKPRSADTTSSSAPLDLARAERSWFAGYQISEALADPLGQAQVEDVTPCRTVRLSSDSRPADAKLDGPALWRRSEPSSSNELTQLIASDITDWARQCGIC